MADERQVLVRFKTKLSAELRVPETPVAIPATLKRYGLSQIINHMLALEPARPFDFIINGVLLRKPLEAHLLEYNLSAEALLDVEYVPAVLPPDLASSAPHEDWVSAVSSSSSAQAFTGSYDGCVRAWDLTGGTPQCSMSWTAHAGGVNSVSSAASRSGAQLLVSAGKDHAVLMWQVSASAPAAGGQPQAPQLLASYQGHTDAVECACLSPSGHMLASCGWDSQLLLWRAGDAVLDAAAEATASGSTAGAAGRAKKRLKAAAAGQDSAADGEHPGHGAAPGGVKEAPVAQLAGHVHCVADAAWATPGVLFSGGWDHSVRRWDVATGINTDTYNGSKAVCCVACPPAHLQGSATQDSPGSLVAFGCSDRIIRVWDSRLRSGEAIAIKGLVGHAGWAVALSWSPSSAHHMASASHDHTVKLWDLRSTIPLATMASHTDKALAVGWAGATSLLSGGADCQLHLHALSTAL